MTDTRYGLGKHIWNVPKELIPSYMRTFYVSIAMYNAALMFIKMTFLCQYYRIFAHSSRRFKHIFIGVAVFVMMWSISQLLIAILTCDPIEGFWDPTAMKTAVCIPEHPFWEVNAAGNIATDVLIFTLPIPVIGKCGYLKNTAMSCISRRLTRQHRAVKASSTTKGYTIRHFCTGFLVRDTILFRHAFES